MTADLIVVLCTAPNAEVGQTLADGLVEAGLAACVNAIPGVTSTYRWQGKLERDSEVQLVIKTRLERFEEVARWIEEHHPYDVPEIIALHAPKVGDGYARWLSDVV